MNPLSLNLGPVAAHPSAAPGRIQTEPNGKRRSDKAHPPPGGMGPPGAALRPGGEATDRGQIAPSNQPDSLPHASAKPAKTDAETAPPIIHEDTVKADTSHAMPALGTAIDLQSLALFLMSGAPPMQADPVTASPQGSLSTNLPADPNAAFASGEVASASGIGVGVPQGDLAQPLEIQFVASQAEDGFEAELQQDTPPANRSGFESQSVSKVPERELTPNPGPAPVEIDASTEAVIAPQRAGNTPSTANEAAEVSPVAPFDALAGAKAQPGIRTGDQTERAEGATAGFTDPAVVPSDASPDGKEAAGEGTSSGPGNFSKAEAPPSESSGLEALPFDGVRAVSAQPAPPNRLQPEAAADLKSLSADVRNRVVAQVADHIESILAVRPRNGILLRLEPHDLGVVEIGLKATEGGVEARLTASHAGVHAALEQSKAQLGVAMEAKGISVVALTVESQTDLGNQAHQQTRPDSGQPQNPSSQGLGLHRTSESAMPTTFYDARRQAAGVDIWI